MAQPAPLNILGHGHGHGFDEPLALLTDCHRRIEMFLDVLRRVAREFSGRPLDAAAERAVRTAKRYFAEAAPKHTADEEESLFPRLRAAAGVAGGAGAHGEGASTVARLQDDHARADVMHARVDVLLGEWLGEGGGALAKGKAAELSSLLDSLGDLYAGHIHTEEAEVFPLAARLLSAPDLAAVGAEMRARRGLGAPPHAPGG
ncbi:MAG: hemerythrin domain-containing protein [Phycisphaerales bacterium]|nr:hemerythrin domain-containing protein [Phycisphaerales bacterium]